LGFVLWQFRDLRRAREITRQQLEAQQAEAMQANAASDESLKEKDADGG
jgi:Tfp pilus assembly protein PilV